MGDYIRLPNGWHTFTELRQVITIIGRDQVLILIAQKRHQIVAWPWRPQVFHHSATGIDLMKPWRRNSPFGRIGAKRKQREYANQQNGVQAGIQVGRDGADVDRSEKVGFQQLPYALIFVPVIPVHPREEPFLIIHKEDARTCLSPVSVQWRESHDLSACGESQSARRTLK